MLFRSCLVSAFALGPFLTQALDTLVGRLTGDDTVTLFGFEVFVPGVRLTMWLAATIMIAAGVLATTSIGWRGDRARVARPEP